MFHASLIPCISLDQFLTPIYTLYQMCKICVSFAVQYIYQERVMPLLYKLCFVTLEAIIHDSSVSDVVIPASDQF